MKTIATLTAAALISAPLAYPAFAWTAPPAWSATNTTSAPTHQEPAQQAAQATEKKDASETYLKQLNPGGSYFRMIDENGVDWGTVDNRYASKIKAAVEAGKKPSEAFSEYSPYQVPAVIQQARKKAADEAAAAAKVALPTDQTATEKAAARNAIPFRREIKSAAGVATIDRDNNVLSLELIDEQGRKWGTVGGIEAEKIIAAVKLGLKPSDAYRSLSGIEEPKAPKPVQVANDPLQAAPQAIAPAPVQPVAPLPDTSAPKSENADL